MERWLGPALAYIPSWLEFQVRQSQQPGCLVAVVHRGKLVLICVNHFFLFLSLVGHHAPRPSKFKADNRLFCW